MMENNKEITIDEQVEKNEVEKTENESTPTKSQKSSNKPEKKSKVKNVAITLLSIAVLALSATLAILLINNKKDDQNKNNETSSKTEEKKEDLNKTEPEQVAEALEGEALLQVNEKLKNILNIHNDGSDSVEGNYIQSTMFSNGSWWKALFSSSLSEDQKVGLILSKSYEKTRNWNQAQEEESAAVTSAVKSSFGPKATYTDQDVEQMKKGVKILDYNTFEKDYKNIFGGTVPALKDEYHVFYKCYNSTFSSELQEFIYTPVMCGGAGIPEGHFLIGDYSKKGDEAYVDVYAAVMDIVNNSVDDFSDFVESSGETRTPVLKYNSPEELNQFRITDDNKSSFDHYHVIFELDSSNTNYIFKSVEKI